MHFSFYLLYSDTSIYGTPNGTFIDASDEQTAISIFKHQLKADIVDQTTYPDRDTEIWVEFHTDRHNAQYVIRAFPGEV